MEEKDNKKAPPHLQVDYRILQLTVKDKDGKEIVNAKTLSAKIVYAYLLGWLNSSDDVFPGAKRIAKDTGVGTHQVAGRCVDDLEKWGWISIERRPGYSHKYTVKPIEEVIRINDQKGDKQPVVNEPVSEPFETAPEPEQHSITRNFHSYDGLFDDDQEPCWDAQPKQTISHATHSDNKYDPGAVDLFASDNKPTVTPQEALARCFVQWYEEGNFRQCTTFKEAVTCCKSLMLSEKGRSINVPAGFENYIMTNHSGIYEHWGVAF
ncbi:helix-turn-helix domain-containing protein [Pantoea sp. ACRSH]|uniref:helix-turn-helix domain-containing protein n=1 Tax=unclassified Pantoea TaxID=2630326 RepID=UPI001EF70E21|nr:MULTISPECIES: helix-turn-helix domain-containing protein [unclassified Pantoea]MCG7368307.1 helix-turn-helix domain-containing protein [Pantoea sp. ACRSH]MCG7398666.1 helix-turn-helix domain-containing protein [Pantoea sp. ACRSC]